MPAITITMVLPWPPIGSKCLADPESLAGLAEHVSGVVVIEIRDEPKAPPPLSTIGSPRAEELQQSGRSRAGRSRIGRALSQR